MKCQAGNLQPYLKRGDCDADFFPLNVEEFSNGLVKPIEHFIQHNRNVMLDEMLDGFLTEHKNSKKKKKKSSLTVSKCFIQHSQAHPTKCSCWIGLLLFHPIFHSCDAISNVKTSNFE